MNKLIKRVATACAAMFLSLAVTTTASAETIELGLSVEQKNAVEMLNYITVLTQETNASKNSQLYMEQAYSMLINNTYPNAVDSRTLSQLTGLLDTMEKYRMLEVKRDRLQYIYEQNQAQAIKSAIPNPIAVLGATHAYTPSKLIASVVYMAASSAASYSAYTSESELKYLKDGWDLDDEAANALHESRKGTFSYMVKMVNDYSLPGDMVLTESTVEEFVKWKQNDNVIRRIQFLESNEDVYQYYGGYWLTLAESYYENGRYTDCLDALSSYEAMETRIFRYDREYARVLPLAIVAAEYSFEDNEYIKYAEQCAKRILANTDYSDWALRYYAAQTYIDIYSRTDDKKDLKNAYDIVLDNVNYLVDGQRELNASYLVKIQEAKAPKGATKSEKSQISQYNKMLKELRKKELPPVSEALLVNCELLSSIIGELELPDSELAKLNEILHRGNARLFMAETLDNLYWFSGPGADMEEPIVAYGGPSVILPARLLTDDVKIAVSVKAGKSAKAAIFEDWKLDTVERGVEGDINTFNAVFTSATAKKYSWEEGQEISISVMFDEEIGIQPLYYEFTTEAAKEGVVDYLQFWKGYKNNPVEYMKFWENSVNFVRVK